MLPARKTLCILAVAACAALALAEPKLPASWDMCKPTDSKCLKSAIQKAARMLEKGNADLGVQALEPFRVGTVHLNRGGNGPLNIDLTFIDPELTGLSSGLVEASKMDVAAGRWVTTFKIPTLTLVGKYKVRGRVLVIPINGEGRCTIKMDNALIKLTIKGHKERQGEKDFFKLESVDFDLVPQKTSFKFVNPAHAQQAELLSRVVSENDKSIMQEMRPSINTAFSKTTRDLIAPVFAVPYDQLFLQ